MKNNIIIGLLFLLFILYNRLWRERLPKFFSDIANSYYYFLYIIIIISFTITLITTLYQIYIKFRKIYREPNYIIKKINIIIEHPYNPYNIISKSIIVLDAFIKNNTPFYDDSYSYSDIIIMKCASILFSTKIKTILFILFLRLAPQLIVCNCFFIDIIYHEKFLYFYKSLKLLIIPLILQYILYSIENFINTNLQGLNDILVIRKLPLQLYSKNVSLEDYDIISIYEKRDLLLSFESNKYIFNNNLSNETIASFNGDLQSAQVSLERAIDIMHNLFYLNKGLLIFKEYKFLIEAPFKIVSYIIYIIGWLYILNYIE